MEYVEKHLFRNEYQYQKRKEQPFQVGLRTRSSLLRRVPPAVPLVVFLSGGLTDVEATEDLNAVNQGKEEMPWRVTFCFGRALQGSTRKVRTLILPKESESKNGYRLTNTEAFTLFNHLLTLSYLLLNGHPKWDSLYIKLIKLTVK